MSRLVADISARAAEMYPADALNSAYEPTTDEMLAFDRCGLSTESRLMALYSARRNPETAAACYRAIADSLVAR